MAFCCVQLGYYLEYNFAKYQYDKRQRQAAADATTTEEVCFKFLH